MSVYYTDDQVTLYHGDCLDVLADLPDASVDAVCTDPPYGLEFMGKEWDRPWAVSATNGVGYAGRDALTLPAHRDNRNANCRACGGRQRGAKRCACVTPQWDRDPAVDMRAFQDWCVAWAAECLRVLKPGGHMLAFGGTRTWHRLACAIEDAGFEVRDSIAWIFAQGFPKSLNIGLDQRFCQCQMSESSRGDDQLRRVRQGVSDLAADTATGEVADLFSPMQRQGAGPRLGDLRASWIESAQDVYADVRAAEPRMEGRRDTEATEGELQGRSVCAVPAGISGDGAQGRLCDGAPAGDGTVDRSAATPVGVRESHRQEPGEQRSVELGAVSDERGPQAGRGRPICGRCGKQSAVGLGTSLKPAFEPIVLARKPLQGTVAANVLAHGTGALNIDGCRIAHRDAADLAESQGKNRHADFGSGVRDNHVYHAHNRPRASEGNYDGTAGRFPANVLLDETAAAELDKQSGILTSGAPGIKRGGNNGPAYGAESRPPGTQMSGFGDSGGASRFFPVFRYTAKAPGSERPTANGIAHPTVKPLELMRWLIRLVTPPGGIVLDPFAGSGTTGEAAIHEHKRAILIEREADYLPLIKARLHKPMEIGFDFEEPA